MKKIPNIHPGEILSDEFEIREERTKISKQLSEIKSYKELALV